MLRFILFCIIACSGYYAWTIFPINYGAGEIAQQSPSIERITLEKPFSFKGSTIKPLKKISGEVRIVEKKRYFFDSRSKLSPSDILVGWKKMSDERNLDHLHFSLNKRYFDLEYSKPPLPLEEIFSQVGFWHLVPSSEEISTEIKKFRKGNLIVIEGLIIDIESDEDFDWRSELTSTNKNEENSIIVWVTKLKVL